MSNKKTEVKETEEKKDQYRGQKKYYLKNKAKLNQQRVLLNYRKKYGYINTLDKIKIFKKHKKIYLLLKELDRDMLNHFLN